MKFIFICCTLSALYLGTLGCRSDSTNISSSFSEEKDSIVYDSILAAKLGADEYGMKQYFVAFLKAGPHRDQDSTTAAQLQKAHLDNITRMANEGKLVLAGPFLDGGDIRGLYIFNVSTLEEAMELTGSDPAVQAGRLIMELHPWYGSAATMMIGDWHKKVQRTFF